MSGNVGGVVGNVGGGKRAPILAKVAGSTRTQASYTPSGGTVTAMTSDLDIVITPPSGTSKVLLKWELTGETNNQGSTGFVVYRDVAGAGYVILPNCKTGTDIWEVITCPTLDGDFTTTPAEDTVAIIDDVPSIGSVCTYRIYCASTRAAVAGNYYLNRTTNSTGSDANEATLATFSGECL